MILASKLIDWNKNKIIKSVVLLVFKRKHDIINNDTNLYIIKYVFL